MLRVIRAVVVDRAFAVALLAAVASGALLYELKGVDALRTAFWKAFNDKDAQAAMDKRKMRYNPVRWEVQQKTLAEIMATPQRVIDRIRKSIGLVK